MIKNIQTRILDMDIDWDLDPRINIIGGDNGSGKTTLLKKIYENIRQVIQGDDTNQDFYLETTGRDLQDVIYLNDQDIPMQRLMNMCFEYGVDKDTTTLELLVRSELDKTNYNVGTLMKFSEVREKYGLSDIGFKYMSTGEKQEFLVYLTVFNTRGKHVLLLLDNMDSQMHIDRKKKLIRNLLDINPHLQIIVTTHSPSMIEGWYQQTKEIHQLSANENAKEQDEDIG